MRQWDSDAVELTRCEENETGKYETAGGVLRDLAIFLRLHPYWAEEELDPYFPDGIHGIAGGERRRRPAARRNANPGPRALRDSLRSEVLPQRIRAGRRHKQVRPFRPASISTNPAICEPVGIDIRQIY